uniref:FLYWCH-type domain-containing protein n=1 Tax=Macrostomum lignano TaxID=282301 RepID=A0A1I8FQM1_9PLAT
PTLPSGLLCRPAKAKKNPLDPTETIVRQRGADVKFRVHREGHVLRSGHTHAICLKRPTGTPQSGMIPNHEHDDSRLLDRGANNWFTTVEERAGYSKYRCARSL